MRVPQKPTGGANANPQTKSQLIPPLHIFRLVTADFAGASFTETMAANNGWLSATTVSFPTRFSAPSF